MRKTVFITGGSRGIGAACVRKFNKEGWKVAFTYNENEAAAKELILELSGDECDSIKIVSGNVFERAGSSAKIDSSDSDDSSTKGFLSKDSDIIALKLSLGEKDDRAEIDKCFELGRRFFGVDSFDGAIVNAGISISGPVDWMKPDDIDTLVNVNLMGSIYTTRTAASEMLKAKTGSIVLISSMWGQRGASCESIYSATKGALDSFGKSLAKELGPSGIRVNIVSPGVIDTEMNKGYSDDDIRMLAEATPLGRIGSADEVAEAVYFLSDSSKSSFITGQILGVDGGIIS